MTKHYDYQVGRVVRHSQTTGHNVIEIDGVAHADLLSSTTARLAAGHYVLVWRRDPESLIIIGKFKGQ